MLTITCISWTVLQEIIGIALLGIISRHLLVCFNAHYDLYILDGVARDNWDSSLGDHQQAFTSMLLIALKYLLRLMLLSLWLILIVMRLGLRLGSRHQPWDPLPCLYLHG